MFVFAMPRKFGYSRRILKEMTAMMLKFSSAYGTPRNFGLRFLFKKSRHINSWRRYFLPMQISCIIMGSFKVMSLWELRMTNSDTWRPWTYRPSLFSITLKRHGSQILRCRWKVIVACLMPTRTRILPLRVTMQISKPSWSPLGKSLMDGVVIGWFISLWRMS